MAIANWTNVKIRDTRIAGMNYYEFARQHGKEIAQICSKIKEKQQKLDRYRNSGGSLTILAESKQLAVIDEDAPFFKDYLLAHLESELDELKIKLKKLLTVDLSEESYSPDEIEVDKTSNVEYSSASIFNPNNLA